MYPVPGSCLVGKKHDGVFQTSTYKLIRLLTLGVGGTPSVISMYLIRISSILLVTERRKQHGQLTNVHLHDHAGITGL